MNPRVTFRAQLTTGYTDWLDGDLSGRFFVCLSSRNPLHAWHQSIMGHRPVQIPFRQMLRLPRARYWHERTDIRSFEPRENARGLGAPT